MGIIPTVYAQNAISPSDEQQISALIYQWNAVLNAEKGAQPDHLYAERVMWYGEEMSSLAVSHKIMDFLAKNKQYEQHIVEKVKIQIVDRFDIDKNNDTLRVNFVKQAGLTSDKQQYYPAEILVKKEGDGWRIVSETDYITQANQNKDFAYLVAKGKFDGENISYAWMMEENPLTGGACRDNEKGSYACQCILKYSPSK